MGEEMWDLNPSYCLKRMDPMFRCRSNFEFTYESSGSSESSESWKHINQYSHQVKDSVQVGMYLHAPCTMTAYMRL